MADKPDSQQPSRGALASTFPGPPPFWTDFTPENLARIEDLRSAAPEYDGDGSVVRLSNLPDDLVNLQPPAEPADGKWRIFGDYYSVRSSRHVSFVIISRASS